MPHNDCDTGLNTRLRACALAVAAAFPAAGLAAPAARVEFAIGNVQIADANGQVRAARKGAEVNSGDSVNTNEGRVQLRFTDGAYVSLQPGSQFRIDDYNYNDKIDGTERGFFSLLRGGLRTITGLVGRTNRKNYQVTTTVATIGIRGTEYTVAYTNSITGSVGEGEIEVCNRGGCSGFANGEAYLVPDVETRPVLTEKKTDLPPTQPDEAPGGKFGEDEGEDTHAKGEERSESGGLPPGSIAPPRNVTLPLNWVLVNDGGSASSSTGDVRFDGAGAANQFCFGAGPTSCFFELTSVSDVATDGIFTWGRGFSTSSSEMLHYVAGFPTPLAELDALKLSGIVMTYAFTGGTAPTMLGANGLVTGSLLGGSATVRWGDPAAAAMGGYGMADVAVSGQIAGTSFSLSSTGNSISSNGQFPFSIGGGCSITGGGSCSISGTVGGPKALGLGIVYHGDLGMQAPVVGTAAFQAPIR